jgi:predicted transcriptional regulator
MKSNATFSLDVEMVETLQAMAKRTDVSRSRLVARALTMLFNEHAMEVRRSEGGPMWLAPIKPRTVPDAEKPADHPRSAPSTDHPSAPEPTPRTDPDGIERVPGRDSISI